MSGAGEAVGIEIDAGVAIVTLARADAMNAVNDAIRGGLVRACATIAEDASVRAVLIRAEGDRAFCVGADIKEVRAPQSQAEARTPAVSLDYVPAIAALTMPVVCAIQGFCLGAGLEIALACDIRIATRTASFGLPEVDLGLIPGAGGTQRLPRVIGAARALDMMLTATRIDAEHAFAIGLITRIADDCAALDGDALALAHMLATKPPLALRQLKAVVNAGIDSDLPSGLSKEREAFAIVRATDDSREAAEAFKAKRKGVYTGR